MTQSLAKSLEVDDYITSPTFTIVNEYEGRMPLYHFDVYRLKGCSYGTGTFRSEQNSAKKERA